MKNNLIKDRVDYWIESAGYDLNTAYSMLKEKRYLYVGFCCHLTCEKILKAYYWQKIQHEPPFTHNLNLLVNVTKLDSVISEDNQNFLDELIPLNIKARYPDDKEKIFELMNYNRARSIFKRTKEFFLWIEQLLNQ